MVHIGYVLVSRRGAILGDLGIYFGMLVFQSLGYLASTVHKLRRSSRQEREKVGTIEGCRVRDS